MTTTRRERTHETIEITVGKTADTRAAMPVRALSIGHGVVSCSCFAG
jgi:hypothetical protein